MEIRSHRAFCYAAPRGAVWQALGRVHAYPTWWPWLRVFDGSTLAEGETWRCAIRSPMWTVRCTLHIGEVDPGRHVAASVTGDVAGHARIELGDRGDGTLVTLTSRLAPAGRWVSLIARVSPRTARWGHDRVVDRAAAQFGTAALAQPGGGSAPG